MNSTICKVIVLRAPKCVCFVIPFFLEVRVVDVPVRATQEEGHTRFLHFPSAVLALIFLARRIQPFLSDPAKKAFRPKIRLFFFWSRLAQHNV